MVTERHLHGDRVGAGRARRQRHSTLQPPPPAGTGTTSLPVALSQLPSGSLLPGRIGYLSLPRIREVVVDQYQAAGTAAMRRLQDSRSDSWILDLRNNSGGNVWPMLAAVHPLLGSGPIGSFIAPPAPPVVIRASPTELTEGAELAVRMAGARQGASTDPVAVLTGQITASAGEFAAIVFRGRPCTTSMGTATQGVPTANRVYTLSDGATLILTTALEADRTGHVYADALIQPEVTVGTNYNATWNHTDSTIRAASRWLRLHHSCNP